MVYNLIIILLAAFILSPGHVSGNTSEQVTSLRDRALYRDALSLNKSHCSALENADSFLLADCISMTGVLLVDLGDYFQSESFFKKALKIRESLKGKHHIDVASSLNDLGELYRHRGEYAKPEALYQRALSIRLKHAGEKNPLTAEIYKNLGELYHDQGYYKKAERFYFKAINILSEAKERANQLALAEVRTWLAMLYAEKNELVEAEVLYQLAISTRNKFLGTKHPETIDSMLGLASLYFSKGDNELSRVLAMNAKEIFQERGDTEHPDYARTIGLLAEIYYYTGLDKRAESLYQNSLEIYKQVYGADNIMTAYAYRDMGWLSANKKDFLKAKFYFNKALKIRTDTLSGKHQEVANSKQDLANVAIMQGDFQQAEILLLEALGIIEQALGVNSIDKAWLLHNLAELSWKRGNIDHAIELMGQAEKIQELEIRRFLSAGSERQKIAYMNTLRRQNNFILSLHMQGDIHNKKAAELSLATILRRKGRVIDVLAETDIKDILPKLPVEVQLDIKGWQQSKQQLSMLSLRQPESLNKEQYAEKLSGLRYKVDIMQSVFEALRSKFGSINTKSINIEHVAKLIPEKYILLEFYIYTPFLNSRLPSDKKWGEKRLAAYTLDHQGNISGIDLGDLSVIKKRFSQARKKLSTPISSIKSVKHAMQALDEVLFKPLLPLLGKTKNIFIAPDGFLNLLPFSALVNAQGEYRSKQYQFTYLTSGRDLLSLPVMQDKRNKLTQPLIMANPSFDQTETLAQNYSTPQLASTRSVNLENFKFTALPHTADEARRLKKLMPTASLLLGNQASEHQIKSVHSPQILHIATHGFFLSGQSSDSWSIEQHPLLSSGLALSGANTPQHDAGQDGILTAMELAEVDLKGTELVVLSACETGLGKTEDGHGVYGLRRALILAGSQSQLLSLWKVNDKITQQLMIAYYKNLHAGMGRGKAIRATRHAIQKHYPHPYYWSSFIASGDWRALSH
jgi:CHAT domain-containing protein